MGKYALFGTAGFALSAATWTLVLLGPLALAALATYPVSLVLRTINWLAAGRERGLTLFKVTGATVGMLGALTYVTILTVAIPAGLLLAPAATWAAYSVLELTSYRAAAREFGLKLFNLAMVSALGIALVLVGLLTEAARLALPALAYLGAPVLILSSVIAAISFARAAARPYGRP